MVIEHLALVIVVRPPKTSEVREVFGSISLFVTTDENKELSRSSLDETQSAELVELHLPSQDDLAALSELCESMEKSSPDIRAREAIDKGFLKDIAPSFDPQSRHEPPGRHNSISAKTIADFPVLVECFNTVAVALGYNAPAPNQKRYKGPILRLRYSRLEHCDMAMGTIRWPIRLCGCRFANQAMFMGVTFSADANFEHCIFESGADFGLAKFQLDAHFNGAFFTSSSAVSATFAGVTFFRNADFDMTRFDSDVQFDYGTFEGQVRFFRSQFKGQGGFVDARFHGESRFEFASFKDQVDFSGAFFAKAPDFNGTSFCNKINFSSANFEQYLDFRNSKFDPDASLNIADLRIRASNVLGGNLRLASSQLSRWRWWPMGTDSLLEADSSRKIEADARAKMMDAKDQGRDEPQKIYQRALKKKRQMLVSACTQYGVLEENFRAQGDPDSRGSEDFCHFRYHDLWRQTHRGPFNPLCWGNWFFMKLCFGYGVYPLRILATGLLLIVLFACLYATGGFGLGTVDWDVVPSVSDVNDVASTLPLSRLTGWRKWGSALYFSSTTFTTVGYGDWHPTGNAKALAASEGIVGVFIMSIFTVIFARKFLR